MADAARKPKPRGAPKWETEARDRLRTAIRRFSKPLADLVARDTNEGDTRLLVTDFLCDGLGFDKYADLTTEYQVKGEFADYTAEIVRLISESVLRAGGPSGVTSKVKCKTVNYALGLTSRTEGECR